MAVSPETCEPNTTANWISSVPAVADETLFIHVPEYRLFALDAESGETLWQRQLAEPSMDKITSGVDGSAVLPPVVGSDSVYVAYEQTLFSVNRQTQRVEQVSLDGPARSLTPMIDGVIVIVSTDGGGRVEYFSAADLSPISHHTPEDDRRPVRRITGTDRQ